VPAGKKAAVQVVTLVAPADHGDNKAVAAPAAVKAEVKQEQKSPAVTATATSAAADSRATPGSNAAREASAEPSGSTGGKTYDFSNKVKLTNPAAACQLFLQHPLVTHVAYHAVG
jgi:hypothetical protein